jgi:hypothetical protein
VIDSINKSKTIGKVNSRTIIAHDSKIISVPTIKNSRNGRRRTSTSSTIRSVVNEVLFCLRWSDVVTFHHIRKYVAFLTNQNVFYKALRINEVCLIWSDMGFVYQNQKRVAFLLIRIYIFLWCDHIPIKNRRVEMQFDIN